MKRNVRKKILLLTVCAMIVGALLLTGCRPPNNIDDPWLDTWQAVVVDKSIEVEKVDVRMTYSALSSSWPPDPQTTADSDVIDKLLNALSAPVNTFYYSYEGYETSFKFDDWVSGFPKCNYYFFDFHVSGSDEIFSVQVTKTGSGIVAYSLGNDRYFRCDKIKDLDALVDAVNEILVFEW